MTHHPHLSPTHITDARSRIDPVFLGSRLLHAGHLPFSLFAKDETDNPIRSFKGRGTDYLMAKQSGDMRPIVAASAGNFGQGLAYSATRRGRSLVVFASVNANPVKIAAMRRFGAEVILDGEDFDAAKMAASRYAETKGLFFVEDGADPAISEGAGTIAAELTEAVEDLDTVFVPLGNGALASGIACWFKAISPKTRIIGVAARGAPCMALSFQARGVISTPGANTIADGIAVRNPVPSAVAWLQDTLDDVVLVEDAEIVEAMVWARDVWGRRLEPAGAAGLAGVLTHATALKGTRVATVLCGANLTDQQVTRWFPG